MTGTTEQKRSEALATARAVKAARKRERKDIETITERCIALAVKQFECDPADVEVHFSGDPLEPIVFIPNGSRTKTAHRVVEG